MNKPSIFGNKLIYSCKNVLFEAFLAPRKLKLLFLGPAGCSSYTGSGVPVSVSRAFIFSLDLILSLLGFVHCQQGEEELY